MKHKIIGKRNLNQPYFLVEVELIPESDTEKEAIKQVEAMEANETQTELVTNYLLFGLNVPYSLHTVERQIKTRFFLKASLD
ncbi:MAG: hypothetical protein IPL84_11210 [Chitinophagaceae bacterium]|nr:hypothetical protein [Chitinophagaceae bacterium]